jgi:hypothetical protein
MATNADFDALIVRIDTATTTLENSVQAVAEGSADVEAAVVEAEAFANTAQQQAVLAANSATAATTASGNAQTQATNANTAANTAIAARNEAQAAVVETQDIVDELLATAPFQEAPLDGGIYGRQNATWALVDTGGATPVTSVNNELPDAQGNVTIEVPTLTSELTNDSGFITAGEVPPSGIEEAPNDGQQYARQNEAWAVVQGGGGVSSGYDYAIPETGNEVGPSEGPFIPWTQWSQANTAYGREAPLTPFDCVMLSSIRRTAAPVVNFLTGYDAFFSSITNLRSLPSGYYEVSNQSFKSGNISGKAGTLQVYKKGVNKYATFIDEGTSGTVRGIYSWRNGTWFNVGTGTA